MSEDLCTAFGGIDCIEDDQSRIIDPAIGIFEAPRISRFDRRADGIAQEVDGSAARQPVPLAEMIVQEQAEPHEPCRSLLV